MTVKDPISTNEYHWGYMRSGATYADGYRLLSDLEAESAVRTEMLAMCKRFHPVAGGLPESMPVILFWRTAGQVWLIGSVTAEQGTNQQRWQLEYVLVVLKDSVVHAAGFDPWRYAGEDVRNRVRRAANAGTEESIYIGSAVKANTEDIRNQSAENQITAGISLYSVERRDAIRLLFHDRCSTKPGRLLADDPPTFATWWPEGKSIPDNTFEIVLAEKLPLPQQPVSLKSTRRARRSAKGRGLLTHGVAFALGAACVLLGQHLSLLPMPPRRLNPAAGSQHSAVMPQHSTHAKPASIHKRSRVNVGRLSARKEQRDKQIQIDPFRSDPTRTGPIQYDPFQSDPTRFDLGGQQ